LIEDYIKYKGKDYTASDGSNFSDLLKRMRELPFGLKLQNHALNHRLNEEFKKFFKDSALPIVREDTKYWFNEELLYPIKNRNISKVIIYIIDKYIESKTNYYFSFINMCVTLKASKDFDQLKEVVLNLLSEKSDARIFEIVSFSILRSHYLRQTILIGKNKEDLTEQKLELYKTGRTNANDGGIDFVMKPLGRFFQVTETTDLKKYFLDIEKIKRFPISFVIKSSKDHNQLLNDISAEAKTMFSDTRVALEYLACVEEVISMPKLTQYFDTIINNGFHEELLAEIINQSKTEFHLGDE
jgi:hypothetical protein